MAHLNLETNTYVHCVSWSPNGDAFAIDFGNGTSNLAVYDAHTLRRRYCHRFTYEETYLGFGHRILRMGFNRDGTRLAYAPHFRYLHLHLHRSETEDALVVGVVFDAMVDRKLFSLTESSVAKVETTEEDMAMDRTPCLIASAQNATLTSSIIKHDALLWNDGALVGRLHHDSPCECAAFSPNGAMVAVGLKMDAVVWNVANRTIVAHLKASDSRPGSSWSASVGVIKWASPEEFVTASCCRVVVWRATDFRRRIDHDIPDDGEEAAYGFMGRTVLDVSPDGDVAVIFGFWGATVVHTDTGARIANSPCEPFQGYDRRCAAMAQGRLLVRNRVYPLIQPRDVSDVASGP